MWLDYISLEFECTDTDSGDKQFHTLNLGGSPRPDATWDDYKLQWEIYDGSTTEQSPFKWCDSEDPTGTHRYEN